jgi:TFIIF-interacting CTD phosphatase-like protein
MYHVLRIRTAAAVAVAASWVLIISAATLAFRERFDAVGPKPPPHLRRHVLVLDLDETLVHTPPATGRTIVRPHARAFVLWAASAFREVVLFTASVASHADAALRAIGPDVDALVRRRFYRGSCSVVAFTVVKDLRVLGEDDLEGVVIVDDRPSAFSLQPRNGVAVPAWYGDEHDTALVDLMPLLREVAAAARPLDVLDAHARK